jgi:hypothetical protein
MAETFLRENPSRSLWSLLGEMIVVQDVQAR